MKPVSVFDIFKIGIGPSSSHTVGPMLAAQHFIQHILAENAKNIDSLKVHLYGSLSLTGKGHGTDRAIICGLEGRGPDSVDPQDFTSALERIDSAHSIALNGKYLLQTSIAEIIEFHQSSLPLHPNGLSFVALSTSSGTTWEKSYYSIGGGFISDENGIPLSLSLQFSEQLPYPFISGNRLLELCVQENKSIAEIVFANELSIRSAEDIENGINSIWSSMDACIERGLLSKGILPGGLSVNRRAAALHDQLKQSTSSSPLHQLDYLSCYALAVNEENAAFGRVVTAPTNGAAGIIPAVFKFYLTQLNGDSAQISKYLLTATAMAILFKSGASLSAAEMGCQGEIGVAASMAAAALTAIQGGTAMQVENAAEIAIEHSLGLTCDPIAGLVQIPCIERNAIGAVKAITASQLALKSDGKHIVSLDQAISAMKKTGDDMHAKYKETSTGGLAISVAAPEC